MRHFCASDLKGRIIVVDTETTGLKPTHGDKIFCFAYCTELGEYGFFNWDSFGKQFIIDVLQNPKNKVVFHNGKFDLKMFYCDGIDVFNAKADIHCTMILSKVLNSTSKKHNLKHLAMRYNNAEPDDKDEIEKWLKSNSRRFKKEHGRKPNFSDAPRDVVKRRVVWDVKETVKIFAKIYPRVMRTCRKLYETERDLMFVCVDMETYGVPIDLTKTQQLKDDCLEGIEVFQMKLDEMIGAIDVERKSKGERTYERVVGFKAGSNAHCVAAWRKLGIELKFKTKPKKKKDGTMSAGGNWAFDEYAIVRYVSKPLAFTIRESGEQGWDWRKFISECQKTIKKNKLHPREIVPPLIWKIKQIKKMVSTYYDHFLNNCTQIKVEPSGRRVGILHCNFNQSEAKTGRFSSSDPNLQNQPRKLGPRECFITRRGRKHFHIDYDQVEMKIFTHFSEDEGMRKAVDEDIHLHTASRVYGIPPEQVTSEQRKRAKAVNFGILYGAGAATIAESLTKRGIPTTTLEASRICAAYHRAFPSVRALTKELSKEIALQGYVENPFGRRYHFEKRFSYRALNYMCQGTSADLMKAAMVKTWKWLRELGVKTRMILTVHDEIVFEVPPAEEWLIPELVEMMEDLNNYNVKITASPEIVRRRWSKKEDYKMAA